MRILLLSGCLALASGAFAEVTYNLIAFPDDATNTFAVEIDQKIYPLETSADIFPLWSATIADASSSSNYRYVQLDKKQKVVTREKFGRKLAKVDADAGATPNEFFNRQKTFTNLPIIPRVFQQKDEQGVENGGDGGGKGKVIDSPEHSRVFDSRQIATIHLTVDSKEFAEMMANPMDETRKPIHAGFRFLNAHTLYSADNVKLKVSGYGIRKFRKVSLHIQFKKSGEDELDGNNQQQNSDSSNDELFFNRPKIKLRSEYLDPTMLHERLYIDLLGAVGVPAYEGTYTRVYVNGEPHGFFLMIEDVEEPYLMHTIHRGAIQDKSALGALYQMDSGSPAPLVYKGKLTTDYKPVLYRNKILGANPPDEPMQQLIAFMKDLRDFDPSMKDGVAYWEKRLDLEQYLRSMVLEYLTGAWDSSWWRANNYMMYFNPEQGRWQFLPVDFDSSFSSADKPDVETTYRRFAQGRMQKKNKDHPLVTKLIYKNKDINRRFETILLDVTKKAFNNKILDPLIDAYEKQIQDEVAWDLTIDRSKLPGIDLGWTLADFHKSIRGPIEKIPSGIKPWIRGRAKSVPLQIGNAKE
ncbi:hypothetical protein BGW42_005558 [Actinomortierella wolfii]|nr:hypothetical protein BGW42_005558 [Actinomortierella wolfii]